MSTINIGGQRGPAGAAGATGPAGPAGAAGSGVPGSPDGTWLQVAGVMGLAATPFVAADWTDVSTVAPNTAAALVFGKVVVTNGTGTALRCTPTPNGFSAATLALDLADGDSICARLSPRRTSVSGGATTFQAQMVIAAGDGADRKWTGVGLSNSASSYPNNQSVGGFENATTNSLTAGSASASATFNANVALDGCLDVRLTRVGTTLVQYVRFGDGAWLQCGAATSGGYPSTAGTFVGFRGQVNSGQTAPFDVVAFKHFAAGTLPGT